MLKKIFCGLLLAGTLAGCFKDDIKDATCNFEPCSVKAPAADIQVVKDYLEAHNITATEHCSGVYYIIDNPGSGKTLTACGALKASYVGSLPDGTVFDEGSFTEFYSLSNMIGGWILTLPLVKEGGKIRLYIPSTLAYGDEPPAGSGIPVNSMLIFDVTVDAVY